MNKLMTVDWQSLFVPATGLAEILVRGTIMYLALFVILRFMARRQSGNFGPADLLVIVLIADAAQNALGAEYRSVTEGALLVLTIVTWDYVLDWLAWRLPIIKAALTRALTEADRRWSNSPQESSCRDAFARRIAEPVAGAGRRGSGPRQERPARR